MKTYRFAVRTAKEILRDPLTLFFGIGFPAVLLLLLSAIQANVTKEVELFEISHLTPGVACFGLSFLTLFSALLIAKDRSGAFLQRLYATPMGAHSFILGYTLPIIPIALAQTVVCYLLALILRLPFSANLFLVLLAVLPNAWLYISMGLLFGSILTDKQVGGICGALLTNLSAWLSGIWFDLALVGGVFEKIANLFPFVHAVELTRAMQNANFAGALPHFLWVLGYDLAITIAAVFLFLRQMKKN